MTDQEIVDRYAAGQSQRDIMAALDCTNYQVREALRKADIPPRDNNGREREAFPEREAFHDRMAAAAQAAGGQSAAEMIRERRDEDPLARIPDLFRHEFLHDWHGGHTKFGLYGDTHHGSLYAADAQRQEFYRCCREAGVESLYHVGDVTAGNGVYRGQLRELRDDCITADGQVARAAKDFAGAGMDIHFILGNHDLKWFKDFGFDIGRHIENEAARLGATHRIECLGHGLARVHLGKKPLACILDLIHPSGGTAYAISYRAQKMVESYQGGDKPHILSIGHFHKADVLPHLRNVVAIQPGCFEWQTSFMREKAIEAHVAGCIVEVWMEKIKGHTSLTRIRTEFVKFYAPTTGAG